MKDLLKKAGFRCPFHKTAVKEKTFLHIDLGNDRATRLKQMRDAIDHFHKHPELIALAFVIPDELLGGYESFQLLRSKLIPFQCERIAAELDVRLFPMLPFHEDSINNDELFKNITVKNRPLGLIGYDIVKLLDKEDPAALDSLVNFASFFETDMTREINKGFPNPGLSSKTKNSDGVEEKLFRVTLDGPVFYYEYKDKVLQRDPSFNKNLFSFITCPLYPKAFGRYSSKVKLVLTRQADIYRVPSGERLRIRMDNNLVLWESGIKIIDMENDVQGEGLWTPDYLEQVL